MRLDKALLIVAHCIPGAWSWGDLGHRTIAWLATEYLSKAEVVHLQRLTGFDDLSDASIWADNITKLPDLAYTQKWHYLNVHDSPPETCAIDLERDHPVDAADILTAFVNHTHAAIDIDSTDQQRREAISFLIHWIGDVHQPLHAEGLNRGGVDLPVLFEGRRTNLHFVWDFESIHKFRGDDRSSAAARAWAMDLASNDTDPDQNLRRECQDLSHALDCIVAWARESNQVVCHSVLNQGIDEILDHELGYVYHEEIVPIIEARVFKAGRRLAAWLRQVLRAVDDISGPPMWPDQLLVGE